jgi:hypothetical protein
LEAERKNKQGVREHQENRCLAKRYLITFLGMANNDCGWQGSKNGWIPSKSNLENSLLIYFLILGTIQIAVDCQNR